MTIDEKKQRYMNLCHAMQTGVKYEMNLSMSDAHQPKHLRVGVNMAMREHGSLIGLLVKKGILTYDEYLDWMIKGMEQEVKMYEERLSNETGKVIRLR